MSFVHLHTHTQYSILDASNKIDNYIARVSSLGMSHRVLPEGQKGRHKAGYRMRGLCGHRKQA